MGMKGWMKNDDKRNAEKEAKKREVECSVIAQEVLKMIIDAGLSMGKLTNQDEKNYDEVALRIIQLMLDNNVRYMDRLFVFQLALQPIDKLKDIVVNSLGRTFDSLLDKALGGNLQELRLKNMDKMLKSEIEFKEKLSAEK